MAEDIYGNFRGNGKQFFNAADISGADFGLSGDESDDSYEEIDSPLPPEPKRTTAQTAGVPSAADRKQLLMQAQRAPAANATLRVGIPRGAPTEADKRALLAQAGMGKKQPISQQRKPPTLQAAPPAAKRAPRSSYNDNDISFSAAEPVERAPAPPPRQQQSMSRVKPKWLKTALGREQADEIVEGMSSGEFIIRSSRKSGYTLVVKDNDSILNLHIEKIENADGSYRLHFGMKDYNTLPELVKDMSEGGTNHMRSNVTREALVLLPDGPSTRSKSLSPIKPIAPIDDDDDGMYEVPGVLRTGSQKSTASNRSNSPHFDQPPPVPGRRRGSIEPSPLADNHHSLPRRSEQENKIIRRCAWHFDVSQVEAKKLVGAGESGTFLVRSSKNKTTAAVEKHVLVINDNGQVVSFQIRIVGGGYVFANRTFKSIDDVVENLRTNAVRGRNGEGLRPDEPVALANFHMSAALRIAQSRNIQDRLDDHAWLIQDRQSALESIRRSGATGKFLVHPTGIPIKPFHVVVRKSANAVKTYEINSSNDFYEFQGRRFKELSEVIEWMQANPNLCEIPLTTAAPGGHLHSSIFVTLPREIEPPVSPSGRRSITLDGFVDATSTVDERRAPRLLPARASAGRVFNIGGMEHLDSHTSTDSGFDAMQDRVARMRMQSNSPRKPPPVQDDDDDDDEFDC